MLETLRRVALRGAVLSRKAASLAKLSFFVGLGAASAIVAACGGAATQTPPQAPEGGTDTGLGPEDAADTGVDAAADVTVDDTSAPDAPASDTRGDTRADTLWDVPYE